MTDINSSYQVIADHLRSAAFLIADGVMPANEGRGYVLRRIMRRAMRHIHKLGAKEPIMHKLVPALIKEMGEAYPELVRAKELIIQTLKIEEERFRTTLGKGMQLLQEALQNLPKNQQFSGVIAFKLYDTYGFPLDLTEDILREKNITIDIKAFDEEMAKQKERARQNWAGSGESKDANIYFSLKEKLGETEFVGYENIKIKTKILAILKNGQEVEEINQRDENIEIILDKTPFYGTSGGQRGDDGNIIINQELKDEQLINYQNLNNVLDIYETKKMAGNLFIHLVKEIRGGFKKGDEVAAIINYRNRQFRAQNHSATHLLHLALRQILGDQITQKGSNVDSHYFTFDFNHNQALSLQELDKVENLVNFYIRQNSPVESAILPIEKAKQKGALALFGEKYDDQVRVLQMGKSIELCGGTHVQFTGNIGVFKIISEKGIAAGIRRIEAKTGFFALEHSKLQEGKLQALLTSLKIKQQFEEIKLPENEFHSAKKGFDDLCYFENELSGNEIVSEFEVKLNEEAIDKIYQLGAEKITEIKTLNKEIEKLKKEQLTKNQNFRIEKIGTINLISHFFEGINAKELRDLTTQIKNQSQHQSNTIIIFFGSFEGKISAILAISSNLADKFAANKIIPQIAEKIGGKGGGGKADLAMCGGNDVKGVDEAIKTIRALI